MEAVIAGLSALGGGIISGLIVLAGAVLARRPALEASYGQGFEDGAGSAAATARSLKYDADTPAGQHGIAEPGGERETE